MSKLKYMLNTFIKPYIANFELFNSTINLVYTFTICKDTSYQNYMFIFFTFKLSKHTFINYINSYIAYPFVVFKDIISINI